VAGPAAAWITTAPSGDEAEAQALAARFGLAFQRRGRRSVDALLAEAGGAPVLVLAAASADLYLPQRDTARGGPSEPAQAGPAGAEGTVQAGPAAAAAGSPSFRASLGLASFRLHRALSGEVDPLVLAARLAPGDRVLDATLGLGGDAMLASFATGAPVVGLEANPLLAAFTQVSLRRPGGAGPLLAAALEAGARVEVRCAEHGAALAALPTGSFDVVLFDPMFRLPSRASPLFGLVRAFASNAPLTREVLQEARRVARRGVLVKDAAPGRELGRLGMAPLPSRRFPRIVFGWCDAL
jgi:hypothetical protein